MIYEITYVTSTVCILLSIFTISLFLSRNYRSNPHSTSIALLSVPAILDPSIRVPIMNYGDTGLLLFQDLYSVVLTTSIIQAVVFLNFYTLHLFTVFNLAPKFNVKQVICINFVVSLITNCLYFGFKFSNASVLYWVIGSYFSCTLWLSACGFSLY